MPLALHFEALIILWPAPSAFLAYTFFSASAKEGIFLLSNTLIGTFVSSRAASQRQLLHSEDQSIFGYAIGPEWQPRLVTFPSWIDILMLHCCLIELVVVSFAGSNSITSGACKAWSRYCHRVCCICILRLIAISEIRKPAQPNHPEFKSKHCIFTLQEHQGPGRWLDLSPAEV